jgi:prophage antirepressor-like protein
MHNRNQGAPAPIVFSFATSDLRVILIDDQPWFVAADVCRALGIQNTSDAMRTLDDDETTLDTIEGRTPTGGIIRTPVRLVNEAGLYGLIFKSRKPEAKTFKRWVTHEVLPAIRKTGGYQQPARSTEPAASDELMGQLRHLIMMTAHNFRYKKQAEDALRARVRTETGAASITKLTNAQCMQGIRTLQSLAGACDRYTSAVSKAENQFLKNFVRSNKPAPLKPTLMLMERDCSRSVLPIDIDPEDLFNLTTNAVGDDVNKLALPYKTSQEH